MLGGQYGHLSTGTSRALACRGLMVEFLLPAVPLLALVASLLLGLYPGLDTAIRLAERIAARGRIGTAASSRRPRLAPSPAPNGGLLLALSLSGRAPPA